MIPVLLWIVGCYALAAAAVHAASALSWRRGNDVKHYVLIAGNQQLQMEWYMRSLRRFSHFTGTEVKVTVIDRGSEDETIGIARYFSRYGMNVNIAAEPLFMSGRSWFEGEGLMPGNKSSDEHRRAEAYSSFDRPVVAQADENNAAHCESGFRPERRSSAWARWQRFLTSWGRRGRRIKPGEDEDSTDVERDRRFIMEPSHLMWMLQAEGIVTEPEHAVLVDLREPADLSKLPL
ncbi:hypothetical protein KZ483_03500 [Paenibacillus sp. sptzw28]|uniref:hypothetical protein n=1 Tax=Paenibacillus sp. sptzw28 TaxID=715179 RepID=UPI001C6E261A|nr:hypothetical protein [Paenibacillus sp. sptzw28]QYR22102.1 hypothetical protein KZ483_03500 [Paenibacillus sp. sptzw28]